ncbi:outer membrane beta-barrel protein [Pedobacter sp. UBA4863]|uniref:outer membrane beta-barrel protein n=1 Tax=Pedobacter sp. UBA4863 TaxID=1947060 RepID=UPI0025EFFF7E|nr:outer membrane beta-barrel protein [Pedobacter sp. UBA4863]
MKNLLALIFFIFSFVPLLSKSQTAEKGIIRGKVIEEVGGLPIPYAVVSVTEANSESPNATFQTDENGFFKFINLKPGIYKVKVSFVGFNNFVISDIYLTPTDFEKNIGSIKLGQSQNSLNEVVITGEKPLIETDGDVITYNVASSIHAEGSSAVDILKDVPMVEVDIDGKPTISGMRSTRIFINGRPSDYMTANIADLLNVLPSDAVEKIEVMTNPPAKYSADGEGIINIVLRKDFKVGFNGNVGIGAGLQGNKNANANASYKGKNYSVNGGGSIRSSVGESYNENFRTNTFPNNTYYYNQYNNSNSDNGGANIRVGLDWDITKKQNLKTSASYAANNGEGLTINNFHHLDEAYVEKQLRNQLNGWDNANKTMVFNADYTYRIDTSGNSLSMGLTLNTNGNNTFRYYDRKYVFPTKTPSLQHNNNDISNEGLNFNLDYEKQLSKKRDRLEVGMAIGVRQNQNDLLVENYNFKFEEFRKNDKLSNDFIYNEKIYAAYASYNIRRKGWSARAALRGEFTNVDFDVSTAQKFVVNPYFSAFPSLSLNRFFKKKYNIGLSYGLRVNRPRENTLNPQVNNADTLNISYGNPNLSPSYTHQIALSMGMYGRNWSFNPRITYSRATGVIERYRVVDGQTGVSETTFDNVGSNYYLSYILIGNYRPTKKTSFNGNFTLIQSNYQSSMNASLNRGGISLRSRAGMSLQISKKAAFEGSLNYANNLVAQGRNKSSINSSLGYRQNFFKNKLSARVAANDPFRGRHSYSSSDGINFSTESFTENNTNNFTFNINYRFTRIKTNKVVVPPASKVVSKTN